MGSSWWVVEDERLGDETKEFFVHGPRAHVSNVLH